MFDTAAVVLVLQCFTIAGAPGKHSARYLTNKHAGNRARDNQTRIFCFSLFLDAPKLQEFSFPKATVLGESLSASCIASKGDRPLTFSWTKDGVTVVNSDRISVNSIAPNVALLTIPAVAVRDMGNYSCIARNAYGEDAVMATLITDGKRNKRTPGNA